jgi:uncharacterized protein YndB with AHSA1/START domain
MVSQGPKHVSRVYVRGSAEKIWQALTDPHLTRQYFWKADIVCEEWRPGNAYRYEIGNQEIVEGHLLDVEEPRRLSMSFAGRWDEAVAADKPSRLMWEINPQPGGVCEVRATNDGFDGVTPTYDRLANGMTFLLSALKTLVETGEPMVLEP